MTPSYADTELLRKQRAVRIARGEDPNGARNKRLAKNAKRKEMIKSIFGLGKKGEGAKVFEEEEEEEEQETR